MLCFSATSDELCDVLTDARCSFMDQQGRFHLARPEALSGRSEAAAEFCKVVMERATDEGGVTEIDLGAGRTPVSDGVLANPIKLLFWLITQGAAVDFHPSVNAYIFSSDPDDILPFLPFHPAPGKGAKEIATVLALRLPIRPAGSGPAGELSVVVGGFELSLPSGAA